MPIAGSPFRRASSFAGGIDLTGDAVAHGGRSATAEGFANIPLAENVAVRIVGFHEHDPGYTANVHSAAELYPTSGIVRDNARLAHHDINADDSYGGRVALKYDLGDWSIEPALTAQHLHVHGASAYRPATGYLKNTRYAAEHLTDRWAHAALTIQGKRGPWT